MVLLGNPLTRTSPREAPVIVPRDKADRVLPYSDWFTARGPIAALSSKSGNKGILIRFCALSARRRGSPVPVFRKRLPRGRRPVTDNHGDSRVAITRIFILHL